ncbi:Uncharacterised protein [BD1-7 clade bacterium]|uniref:HTH araC/xylS-type domain-containing protein n=1 Tax=BD1-7 clade bacterium TaxID=2029982 RepID=A0A5S9QZ15_9GAMM|nr:Uncharacterised protein [BD1-7 clade bacterium]
MQIPQDNNIAETIRKIETNSIEELTKFHRQKNRQYTQLRAGTLAGTLSEVNLGSVHLMREKINVGARIVAAPGDAFLPFGTILSDDDDYRFCAEDGRNNAIIQATGGNWDISFQHSLDYIAVVYEREAFMRQFDDLCQRSCPDQWIASQVKSTDPQALKTFNHGVSRLLQYTVDHTDALQCHQARKALSADLFSLTLKVLAPTADLQETLKSPSRRLQGVHRVIDYLREHAAELPTIPELCAIAGLSERSLEYGFKEYLSITPVRYLKLVRLNGARRDLMAGFGANLLVSDVALRWGFLEFGRFARDYRMLFEELPSTTLQTQY